MYITIYIKTIVIYILLMFYIKIPKIKWLKYYAIEVFT